MEKTIYTPEQLGAALKSYRKTKGVSQTEAGINVGLLQKTVSALEIDTSKSSVDSLFKLISALNLELVLRPKGVEVDETTDAEW
ncbi:MAG: transcriptional regulator [Gammaproteobacteria bacterium]|nr:transcriptional regulator [Gammaproteobacteria bacterium]